MNYRDFMLSKLPELDETQKLTMGAMGLCGEAGEASELVKKHLFAGKPLDYAKLVLELGDVRFYLELLAHVCGVSMEEIEAANMTKLNARFPQGYSHQASAIRADTLEPKN